MKIFRGRLLRLSLGLSLLFLLSHSVYAQTQRSDREFDMLKGAVKSVQTERADLSTIDGKTVEEKREVSTVENYDEAGNLTKVEKYEDGTLLEIETYFLLNNERVYKTEKIRRSKYRGGSASRSDTKPDLRFTIKFKYKFDAQGNRIEQTVITNRDEATSRHVYKYDARNNLVADIVYLLNSASTTTTRTTTYKFDEKGNVFEASREKPHIKYSYTYQSFDDKGNWTKRTVKRVSKDDGKASESSSVYYRTIVYF